MIDAPQVVCPRRPKLGSWVLSGAKPLVEGFARTSIKIAQDSKRYSAAAEGLRTRVWRLVNSRVGARPVRH